jgi:hypothetical protein
MIRSKIFTILFFIVILLSLVKIISWQSPGVNITGKYCLDHLNPDSEADFNMKFYPSSGVIFDVYYIKNANHNCVNPYFPVILIKSNIMHDGWVQIVQTNSDDLALKLFIDYDPKMTTEPFYSYAQHFYDAPLWTYNLFFKKSFKWNAHVFAIKIDKENQIIQILGGIGWGFELNPTNLRPKSYRPYLLNESEIAESWEVLRNKFPDYKKIR